MHDYIDGRLTGSDSELVSVHLDECAACREDYQNTLSVIELLKDVRIPPASADFATRVLERASDVGKAPAGRRLPYFASGIAASFFIVVLLLSSMISPTRPSAPVVLIGDQLQTVKVAIESARAVDSIRMTIDVSDNLEISGYQSRKVISWNTRLEKGTNIIALPITAIAQGDGEINARVGLQDREKVFTIKTRYKSAGAAGSDYPLLAALQRENRQVQPQ